LIPPPTPPMLCLSDHCVFFLTRHSFNQADASMTRRYGGTGPRPWPSETTRDISAADCRSKASSGIGKASFPALLAVTWCSSPRQSHRTRFLARCRPWVRPAKNQAGSAFCWPTTDPITRPASEHTSLSGPAIQVNLAEEGPEDGVEAGRSRGSDGRPFDVVLMDMQSRFSTATERLSSCGRVYGLTRDYSPRARPSRARHEGEREKMLKAGLTPTMPTKPTDRRGCWPQICAAC